MTLIPRPTVIALSPDGSHWWDGWAWRPTFSPDGRWRWNGSYWEPLAVAGGPAWARPYASARTRAIWTKISLGAVIVGFLLSAMTDLTVLVMRTTVGTLTSDQQNLADVLQGLPALLSLATLAMAVVTFLMWVHRVYRNLPALGAHSLRFSPGWAVGAWFIPFLNLVRPYEVLREVWLWTSPGQGRGVRLLQWWWGIWLASRLFGLIAHPGNSAASDSLDLIANLVTITAAVLAVMVVHKLTAFQESRAG